VTATPDRWVVGTCGLMAGLRIVFSTQPGHGHLNPLLPVARACQVAGHTVLFATAPRFCPTVQGLGFQCRAAGARDATRLNMPSS
jgi:UDP:flavonoid glycosyltransferase YjiC (YdhE family)